MICSNKKTCYITYYMPLNRSRHAGHVLLQRFEKIPIIGSLNSDIPSIAAVARGKQTKAGHKDAECR